MYLLDVRKFYIKTSLIFPITAISDIVKIMILKKKKIPGFDIHSGLSCQTFPLSGQVLLPVEKSCLQLTPH